MNTSILKHLRLLAVGPLLVSSAYAQQSTDVLSANLHPQSESLETRIQEARQDPEQFWEHHTVGNFEKGSEEGTYERYILYDVGSSGIRVNVSDVNPRTFEVRKVYEKRINEPTMNLTEALVEAKFAVFAAIQSYVEGLDCPPGLIEEKAIGVATAGLRSSGEAGEELASYINNIGVDFSIASQSQEGELAWMGARFHLEQQGQKMDPASMVVWDCGGGSMQVMSLNDQEDLTIAGTEVAGFTFKQLVLRNILNRLDVKDKGSPNPMTEVQVTQSLDLAKTFLSQGTDLDGQAKKGYDATDLESAKKVLQHNGGVVYGLGPVQITVGLFFSNLATHRNLDYYDLEGIKAGIQLLVGKTDEEMKSYAQMSGSEGFEAQLLTTLILIEAQMELLGAEKVIPLKGLNNTDGLLGEALLKSN